MSKDLASFELPFFDFDVQELNRWAAELVGHGRAFEPDVVILDRPTLAGIWVNADFPRIELHPIFNVPWLPIEVMRHVLIHEHIHKLIPPREVEPGVVKHHPPEFWEVERELSPQGTVAWAWMQHEWRAVMRRDELCEGYWVKRTWRRDLAIARKHLEKLCRAEGVVPPPERHTTWQDALEGCRGLRVASGSVTDEPDLPGIHTGTY